MFKMDVAGGRKVAVPIRVLDKPAGATAQLVRSGKTVARAEVTLTPPKKWYLFDVQVSHHDLGYADYYHMMRRDVREWGIELALDCCRKTDTWPEESRFHWTVETSEPMTGFLQYQPDSVISELARRIREGRIDLGALHNSVSTEHMSYEVLARAFYTPNRYIVDWMGIPPSRTALDTDVVGFVRSLPLYTKEADLPYFMMGVNSSVQAFDQAFRDPAWYWKAPDQDNKMTLFKTWPYYSPDRLMAYNQEEILALLERYEGRTDYPYDCILAEDSYDFGLPEMANVEKIRAWNELYSNPVLVSSTFTKFFDRLSGQRQVRDFTAYDKDAPNAWSDEDLADARLETDARYLGYRIPGVEKLATVTTAVGGGMYPWSDLYQAYNKLIMYHEHTDGAYAEGPIYVPPSLKDSTAANANYYEVEQEMHRALVSEGRGFLERAESDVYGRLKKMIITGGETTLAVYNPLNYTRTDVVTFEPPAGGGGWQVYESGSGRLAATQQWPDGTWMFVAADVPQAGYRTFTLKPAASSGNAREVPVTGAGTLENKFYRITFDPATGGISSILDKELNRELVDQAAPQKFNQYLYQRFETTRYSVPMKTYLPEKTEFSLVKGAVASMMTSTVRAFGCESISQKVILYEDLKRIDFIVDLDKSPSGRSLADYRQGNARNKEALFYCLPFQVPGFTIRHELPGAVVEPIAGQFNGSSTDYYGIQHFTDLSNPDFGITLATVDAPLVEYGWPRPAPWGKPDGYEHIMKNPENSRVYLYLANNMFFTNIRMSQPGMMRFRWSVRSHAGDWKQGKASQFGWETSHPLEAMLLPKNQKGILPADRYSFFTLDNDHVACVAVKPAEANGIGFILRFFELTGREAPVKAQLNFIGAVREACETNLVEVDRPIPVAVMGSNRISFTVPAYGMKTIRVIPDEPALGEVRSLQAEPLSDRQIRLQWDNPGEPAAYFRIFRGTQPDFACDLRHFAGASGTDGFTDQPVLNYGGWINQYVEPGTDYYYKVCAVSRGNIQGRPSDPVKATTMSSAVKDLPPARIEGLYVTHVSPITSDNYLSLFFYSSIESDVAAYRIYRSRQQGFVPGKENLLAEIDPSLKIRHTTPHGFNSVERSLSEFTMQMYADESVEANVTYYYRVCAVDRAGQEGEASDEVQGTARLSHLVIEGNRFFFSGGTEALIKPSFTDGSEVRYTLDGTDPVKSSSLYTGPVHITRAAKLKAAVFYPGSNEPKAQSEAEFATALYPAPTYNTTYGARWAGSGIYNLVDGQRGDFWNDGFWQGFEYDNLDVVVDLGQIREIRQAGLGTIQFLASWIFLPDEVEFRISKDGINYTPVGKVRKDPAFERTEDMLHEFLVEFAPAQVRYIRVIAKNKAICPEWHVGAGGKAWIFADEITVR